MTPIPVEWVVKTRLYAAPGSNATPLMQGISCELPKQAGDKARPALTYAPMWSKADTKPDDAQAICEQMFWRTRLAMFGGDRDTWIAAFSLPLTMGTFGVTRQLTKEQDLLDLYQDLTCQLQSNGITDMVRRTIACEYRAPDLIHTTYESRLLQGTLLVSTYVGYGNIRYIDGSWQIVDNSYATAENVPHASALAGRA